MVLGIIGIIIGLVLTIIGIVQNSSLKGQLLSALGGGSPGTIHIIVGIVAMIGGAVLIYSYNKKKKG